jgi:E1A-binding protein p400
LSYLAFVTQTQQEIDFEMTTTGSTNPSASPQPSYLELITRRESIHRRLDEVQIPHKLSLSKRGSQSDDVCTNLNVPLFNNSAKSLDTHRDFLLKEMQWLAADYSAERKRHIAVGRKISSSVLNYFTTKHVRQQKEIILAKQKTKKLANKISKLQQSQFWSKLEKLITYKQKLHHIQQRNHAMNRELIQLIKQTEKFAAESSVFSEILPGVIEDNTCSISRTSDIKQTSDNDQVKQENEMIDKWSPVRATENHPSSLSTLSGQKRDTSSLVKVALSPRKESSVRSFKSDDNNKPRYSTRSKRTVRFGVASEGSETTLDVTNSTQSPSTQKKVKSTSKKQKRLRYDPINDDDEDYVSHELQDDETTMELEECLPQDITHQEEIRLLQEESEISIEELRAQYSSIYGSHHDEMVEDEKDDEMVDDEKDDEMVDDEKDDEMVDDEKDDEMVEDEKDDEMVEDGHDDEIDEEKRTLHQAPPNLNARANSDMVVDADMVETDELTLTENDKISGRENQPDEDCQNFSQFDETEVTTRPFLMAPWLKIREYQLVGLSWLTSLHLRGLNGILADGTLWAVRLLCSTSSQLQISSELNYAAFRDGTPVV